MIPNDKNIPIPRQPDGDAFYVHCTGGFRGAKVKEDVWLIEPVLVGGQPCRQGYFSDTEFQKLTRESALAPIAFQTMGWSNGTYHSAWTPIIPRRTNHFRGPSDLWSSVSTNLSRQRSRSQLTSLATPTREKIGSLLDDATDEERLAKSISLSLRSMDISVEQIAEYYHEQLTNGLASGHIDGQWSATTLDQTLFAHVHSFFVHLGAARDYLGALLAKRIVKDPNKFDSMAKLVDVLRSQHFESDRLLDLLRSRRFFQPSASKPNKWELAGWLKEASWLRNEFVHRRPYGSKYVERFGRVMPAARVSGLFRYFHPIVTDKEGEKDVLDVISYHYKNTTSLFQELAEVSGHDTSMMQITDEDIISMKVPRR